MKVTGSQAIPFLQGMVTNDVRPLEKPGAEPVYAALLTPKGKFLHDLIIYRQEESSSGASSSQGPTLLAELDAAGKQKAIDWLTRYKLRKPVVLEDVSSDYQVWAAFGDGSSGPAAAPRPWHRDPRLPELGLRAVLPSSQPPSGLSPTSEEEYRRLRCMLGVAEGETEIPAEKAAPLDYNLDELHGVSYKKGCYIGQERNSFTHYRGIIRKRVMPIRLQTTQGVKVGQDVVVQGSGEVVGTVRAAAQEYGLAYLKLSTALQSAAGQVQLEVQGEGAVVPLQAQRPSWWPEAWGHEEGGEQ